MLAIYPSIDHGSFSSNIWRQNPNDWPILRLWNICLHFLSSCQKHFPSLQLNKIFFQRPNAPRRSEWQASMEPVMVLLFVRPSRRWRSPSTPSTSALSAARWVSPASASTKNSSPVLTFNLNFTIFRRTWSVKLSVSGSAAPRTAELLLPEVPTLTRPLPRPQSDQPSDDWGSWRTCKSWTSICWCDRASK